MTQPVQFPARQQRGLAKLATLSLDFTINNTLDPRITFTRASSATQYNSAGTLIEVGSDVARLDYDPTTLAPKGLLIEEQRTNLLTYSSEFENAAWTKSVGVTVTTNAITSPDGTTSADLISAPQDSGCYQTLLSVGTGVTVTNSVYIKAGTATQLLFRDDLGAGRHIVINPVTGQITGSSGTIIASGSVAIGNGWYRYFMTYVTDSANTRSWVRNDTTGTLTYYEWGAQLEDGAFPTSYIPTTSATVTRAADNVSMVGSNFSSWYNQSEGTVVASASFTNTSSYNAVYTISDGTTANSIRTIQWNNGTDRPLLITTTGTTQTSYSTTGQVGSVKFCGAFKLNDANYAKNGVLGVDDTLVTLPAVDQLFLGASTATSHYLNGHIQSIKYYPRRLPNADLQRLTR